MTIGRSKAAGWGANEVASSSQLTTLDTNIAKAVDRTSAGDTVSGRLALSGAGRIGLSYVNGTDADHTYQADGGNLVIGVVSLTANRTYTFSTTNAVSGDTITIYASTILTTYEATIKNNAGATIFTVGNEDTSDGQWVTLLFLADWVVFKSPVSGVRRKTFTSNGSWTCPPNVFYATLDGFGAGAGGASGLYVAGIATNTNGPGGGGGGGALPGSLTIPVTPGTTYTVVIGAGGMGGTGGTSANYGGDGGDTTFASGATVLAAFLGAQGGYVGVATTTTNQQMWAPGGASVRTAPRSASTGYATNFAGTISGGIVPGGAPIASGPSVGGYGFWVTTAGTGHGIGGAAAGGATTVANLVGGAPGSQAGNSGGYSGGGAGGGGAAGPNGPGAAGGNGGSSGTSTGGNGTAGSNAAANSGAGGGGGGSYGAGTATNGNSGSGGNGGSGQLTISWVK